MQQRTSWWEETERFRDLDEIVERSASSGSARWRWLLAGAVAGLAAFGAWRALGMAETQGLPALGKLEVGPGRAAPPAAVAARAPARDEGGSPQPTTRTAGYRASEQGPSEPVGPSEAEPTSAEPAEAPTDDAYPQEAADSGSFYIQVASLRSKERADLLVERLARQGHPATRESVGLRGRGWWHSVKVGPFHTRIEAESYRLRFEPLQGRATVVMPRSTGDFHVQVASLRSRDKADALVEQLQRQGHHARRRSAEVRNRGTWHTVRIGPFDSRSEAEAYRELLGPSERRGAVVIPFELPQVDPALATAARGERGGEAPR